MSKDQHLRECGECLIKYLSSWPEKRLKTIQAHLLRAAAATAERAIRGHALHCGLPDVETWAASWLSGVDRSEDTAKHIQSNFRKIIQRLRNQDRVRDATLLEAAAYAVVTAEAAALATTSAAATDVLLCLSSLSWSGWAAAWTAARAVATPENRDDSGHAAKNEELRLQARDLDAVLASW